MKLTIPKHNLATALRRVQGAISGRATNAALGGVLLRATDGLQAMATNLDLQISHKTEANVIEPGAALLPFAALNQHVTNFGPQDVELAVDDKFRCTLVCGDSRGSLSGMDPKEFTEFPQQERKGFTMAQADLKAALRKTLIAASESALQFVLCGVLVELKKNRLVFVGTDGKMMSIVRHLLDGDGIRSIIPIKGAQEAMRLLESDGEATIQFGPTAVEFTIGDTSLSTRLIDAIYPPYADLLPKQPAHRITLNREELLSAVKYVGWIVDPNNFARTSFEFSANKIEVHQVSSTNEARRGIAVKYDGPEMQFKLPPEQVYAVLNAVDEDEVTMEIIDTITAALIKAGNLTALMMPFRQGL